MFSLYRYMKNINSHPNHLIYLKNTLKIYNIHEKPKFFRVRNLWSKGKKRLDGKLKEHKLVIQSKTKDYEWPGDMQREICINLWKKPPSFCRWHQKVSQHCILQLKHRLERMRAAWSVNWRNQDLSHLWQRGNTVLSWSWSKKISS